MRCRIKPPNNNKLLPPPPPPPPPLPVFIQQTKLDIHRNCPMTASHTHLRIYWYRASFSWNTEACMHETSGQFSVHLPLTMSRTCHLQTAFQSLLRWQTFYQCNIDLGRLATCTLCPYQHICTWNWLGQCHNSSSSPPLQHKSHLQRQQQLKCLDQQPWK